MREDVKKFMMSLQDDICSSLENIDGASFHQDLWERPGGGGGRSRVITGKVIEKGGVNFSAVHGALPDKIRSALKIPAQNFFATGVSIVLHPHNPWAPIIHMNVRFFDTDSGHAWFGGGIDLTPHYIIPEDAMFFHQSLKSVCDKHDLDYYGRFKKWADDYFYIKHRKETRGIGGIFYDRLSADDNHTLQERFSFTQDVGRAFVPIYSTLINRRAESTFDGSHKEWQFHRRGRYVEFNLVWDRGTKFGLGTDGRTESILMSMPPMAQWTYMHKTEEGSKEKYTLDHLKKEIDWVNYTIE